MVSTNLWQFSMKMCPNSSLETCLYFGGKSGFWLCIWALGRHITSNASKEKRLLTLGRYLLFTDSTIPQVLYSKWILLYCPCKNINSQQKICLYIGTFVIEVFNIIHYQGLDRPLESISLQNLAFQRLSRSCPRATHTSRGVCEIFKKVIRCIEFF